MNNWKNHKLLSAFALVVCLLFSGLSEAGWRHHRHHYRHWNHHGHHHFWHHTHHDHHWRR